MVSTFQVKKNWMLMEKGEDNDNRVGDNKGDHDDDDDGHSKR